jgi:hypothetical protein
MTIPEESLQGRRLVAWLDGGGDPETVTALADQFARS